MPLTKKDLARLKEEFNKLDYPGRLRFMTKEFASFSQYANERGGVPDFSVLPQNREETLLYNEWKNELFLHVFRPDGPEPNIDLSFEWLRDRYLKTIRAIKKHNAYPDEALQKYLAEQTHEYTQKAAKLEPVFQEYNGIWDWSLKTPEHPTLALEGQAVYSYLAYLKQQELKPTTGKMPVIPVHILKKVYKRFNGELWNPIPEGDFISLFNSAKRGRLKGEKHGYQVLIAYLFKNLCITIGVPFTSLEPRVGSFDRVDSSEKRQKSDMKATIDDFLKQMKK